MISAVEAINGQDMDKAKSILLSTLAKDPTNDAAWYYLAQTELSKGNVDEAEEYLKKAVELDSSNFWYRYKLARL